MKKLILYISFLIPAIMLAQQVTTSIDRDSMRIGEEVILKLKVKSSADSVKFLAKSNLGRLEIIEDYPVDTLESGQTLQKRYGLTQFDAGQYFIPPVQVIREGDTLESAVMQIRVTDVAVDTTKQKMYPIKGYMDVPSARGDWSWLWWLLLLIPLAGIIWYALSRKRKNRDPETYLPPYEWAMYRLNRLKAKESSPSQNLKEHYTELSYVVRRFLDKKVYQNTLESTTSELLDQLETAAQKRNVTIVASVKQNIETLLKRADNVKFASHRPDAITANEDYDRTRKIVDDIHHVLPPPSEEELMQDPVYRRKKRQKALLFRGLIGTGITVAVLVIAFATWVAIDGVQDVRYTLLGDDVREQYENRNEWFTSSYGVPSITLTTPDVLRRLDGVGTDSAKQYTDGLEMFGYQDLGAPVFVKSTRSEMPLNADENPAVYKSLIRLIAFDYTLSKDIKNVITFE